MSKMKLTYPQQIQYSIRYYSKKLSDCSIELPNSLVEAEEAQDEIEKLMKEIKSLNQGEKI